MRFINTLFPNLAGQTLLVVAIALSIVIAVYLLFAISEWKMFTKMGEKGWKAFIPLYNVYILLKRCSKVSYFGQMIIAGVVYSIVNILFSLRHYRVIPMVELRSRIFRQTIQKFAGCSSATGKNFCEV